uniref:Uncharacterized protein n=1 Tax=Palpitomonas bilix TaxID=652834 RepID=A0A7S3FZM7_9EUKA
MEDEHAALTGGAVEEDSESEEEEEEVKGPVQAIKREIRREVMIESPKSKSVSVPGKPAAISVEGSELRERTPAKRLRPPTPAKARSPYRAGASRDPPPRPYSHRFGILGFVQMNVCFLLLFFAKQGAIDGGRPHPELLRSLALGGESGDNVAHVGVCNNDMFIATGIIGALLSFLPYITSVATHSQVTHKALLAWFGCMEGVAAALAGCTVGTGVFGAVITPASLPGCFFSVWGLGATVCSLFLCFLFLAFAVEMQKARGVTLPSRLTAFTDAIQSRDFYRKQVDRMKNVAKRNYKGKGKSRVQTGGIVACTQCGAKTKLSVSAIRNVRTLSTYPCQSCGASVPIYEKQGE